MGHLGHSEQGHNSSGAQSVYPTYGDASKARLQSKQGNSYNESSSKAELQGKQGSSTHKAPPGQLVSGQHIFQGTRSTNVNANINSLPIDKVNQKVKSVSNNSSEVNNIVNSNATVKLGTEKVKNGIYNTTSQTNLDKLVIIKELRRLNPTWNDMDIANFIESGGKRIPRKSKFSNESKGVNQASFVELDKLEDDLTFGLGLRGDTNIGVALSRNDYGKMLDLLSGNFQAGSQTYKNQQILLNTKNKFSSTSDFQKALAGFPSSISVAGKIIGGIDELLRNEPMVGHEEGINDIGWNNLALRQIRRSKEDGILELMPDGSNPINVILQLGNQEEIAQANFLKTLIGDKPETREFQSQKKKSQEDMIPEDDILDIGPVYGFEEYEQYLADALKTGIGSDNISSLYFDGDSLNVNEDFKINAADSRMNEGIDNSSYNIDSSTTDEMINRDESEESSTDTNIAVKWGGPRDRRSFEWMMTNQRPDGALEISEPTDVKEKLNTHNATQIHKYYYNKFTGKYEHYNVNNGTMEELDDFQMRDLLNISYVTSAKQGGIVGFMERV